ncbi:MAG: hypothetical protein K8H87_04285 [Pseudorhodoplanes sp.]|nr:hypothetical protein [Pseudorhodoplanes sp.]
MVGVDHLPAYPQAAAAIAARRRIQAIGADREKTGKRSRLKRDDFSPNRHLALAFCLSMIFSENRFSRFGIML